MKNSAMQNIIRRNTRYNDIDEIFEMQPILRILIYSINCIR